mmetsp:Transcript_53728/g.143962  ORF Transcript_53728/g.143962 Transcript_53728/m.143962 type:complete len:91 (-) Transcript_53728:630-902(-)
MPCPARVDRLSKSALHIRQHERTEVTKSAGTAAELKARAAPPQDEQIQGTPWRVQEVHAGPLLRIQAMIVSCALLASGTKPANHWKACGR